MSTVVALGDLLELSDSGVWGEEDSTSGVSVLRSTNFNSDGSLDLSKLTFRVLEERNKERKLLRPGDILLEKSGGGPKQPVGRVCLFKGADRPHSFGNFIARLRPREGVLSEYLFYFLWYFHATGKTNHYQKQTTGIRNLEFTRYLTINIPVVPIEEQRRIIDLLSRAEGIVRLRREAQKKAAEIIPALFLDMFGDPATNPKGWKVVKIGELAALVTSGSTPRGGAEVYVDDGPYFIRSQNVLMNELVLSDAARIPRSVHKQMSRTKVQAGDVLLNITGASIGRVAWVDALDQEANVNQHVCIIRVKRELVVPAFLSVCLSMPFNQMMINTVQAGASRQALNHEQVRGIKIGLPPINVQRSFSDRIAGVLSITTQQETALNRAQATFDALLARVFSEGDRQAAVNTVDRMTVA